MLGAPQHYLAVIKVVGVGGGGCNAVNRMIDAGLKGVEFIAINTDAQSLLLSDADVKLDIGRQLTRGLGAGSDPESAGRPPKSTARRSKRCSRAPTWCSSPRARAAAPAPVARRSSRRSRSEIGALTIGVVTRPFGFEGRRRSVQAESGIQKLKEKVDTIIIIPNERLFQVSDEHTSMLNAFKMADEVLLQGVQGITDLITTPGLINTDFADVKMILTSAGSALMGVGYASGDGRAVTAARAAISSPLLEASIEGARGILLNVSGPSDLGLFELNEAAEIIGAGRAPRRQHHLRCGHRRRARRRGAHHRDRGRLRPLRGRAARARARTPRRARSVSTTRTRSRATTPSTSATTTSTSPSSCAERPPRPPRGPARARRRSGAATGAAASRRAPYDTCNVGDHVGDDADAVAREPRSASPTARRAARARARGSGSTRCTASPSSTSRRAADRAADRRRVASRRRPGLPLAIVTADCAPVVLASDDAVGVVHAGHRGLADGVLEAAVERAPRDRARDRARVPRPVHPRRVLRVRRRPTSRRFVARFGPEVEGRTRDGRTGARPPGRVCASRSREAGVDALDDCGVCTADVARPTSRTGATARPAGRSRSRCSLEHRRERVANAPVDLRRAGDGARAHRPRPRGTPAAPPTSHAGRGLEGAAGRDAVADALAAGQTRARREPRAGARGQGRRRWRTPSPHRPGTSSDGSSATRCGALAPYVALLALDRPGRARARARAPRARRAGARAGQRGRRDRRRAAATRRRPRRSSIVCATPALRGRRAHDGAARRSTIPVRTSRRCATLADAARTARAVDGYDGDFEAAIGEGATLRTRRERGVRSSPRRRAVCDDRVSRTDAPSSVLDGCRRTRACRCFARRWSTWASSTTTSTTATTPSTTRTTTYEDAPRAAPERPRSCAARDRAGRDERTEPGDRHPQPPRARRAGRRSRRRRGRPR